MRPFTLCNATKVLITVFALILSLTGFAEARDRDGDRHKIRRPHHERQIRDRSETVSGVSADRYYRRDSRNRREYRSHDGYRFARNDRRIDVREYREDNRKRHYRGDGFNSYGSGGTYFGGLSAWRERGNGIYFRSERYGYDDGASNWYRGPGAKIICVNPNRPGRSCSWESGVCVIRR